MRLFKTKVPVSNLSQPDAVTCQATCLAMALNQPASQVQVIRAKLRTLGVAGDPAVMGQVLKQYLKQNQYKFELNASLNQCVEWIKAGEFLITHGWFTGSGHVICLDEVEVDPQTLGFRFSVKDPWAEFDFSNWRYLPGATFYDGFYSALGIYASCVVGQSPSHARSIYRSRTLNPNQPGAWVHRISPNT